jgi:hypothetical protein
MQKIGNYDNVLNDSNSQTKFDNLNEMEFLLHLFEALSGVLKEKFKKYVFYVFSTNDSSILPGVINQNVDADKTILIYVSDERGFIPDQLRPFFKAIFKSYMPYEPGGNIFSFTLGHINDVVFLSDNLPKIKDRSINMFFSGNLHKNRSDLYRQFTVLRFVPLAVLIKMVRGPLRNIFLKFFGSNFSSVDKKVEIHFTNGFMRGYSKKEYKSFLLQTRILLCPKGFVSPETFRLFEGLNAGCIVISDKLPELDIYKNVPVIQIDSWKEGLKKADELLSNPVMMQQIQDSGVMWWSNNCSYDAVAKRISKLIDS